MKKLILPIAMFILVTGLVFGFSQYFIRDGIKCACAGCCRGCPGDCDLNLGFPLIYYSQGYNWGVAALGGDKDGDVKILYPTGLFVDVFVWIISGILIYFFIWRRK